jgi:hypothetical protein
LSEQSRDFCNLPGGSDAYWRGKRVPTARIGRGIATRHKIQPQREATSSSYLEPSTNSVHATGDRLHEPLCQHVLTSHRPVVELCAHAEVGIVGDNGSSCRRYRARVALPRERPVAQARTKVARQHRTIGDRVLQRRDGRALTGQGIALRGHL